MSSWSPARSSLLRHCPRQYLLRHVLHAVPAQPDSVSKLRGRVIHAGLAAAFAERATGEPGDRHRPMMARHYAAAEHAMHEHSDTPMLSSVEQAGAIAQAFEVLRTIAPPHPTAILAVELEFSLEVDGESINAVTDLVLRTGSTSLHVREWKTGTVSWEPVADDALPLYGLMALQRWPWAQKVTVGLYSTRINREQVQTLTPVHIQRLRDRLTRDARWDRQARPGLSVGTVDALYPTDVGSHCGGCPFRSYCPQFRSVTNLPVRPGVDVVAERHRLAAALERHA